MAYISQFASLICDIYHAFDKYPTTTNVPLILFLCLEPNLRSIFYMIIILIILKSTGHFHAEK